jgi:aspartate/methionine/tyrosine aminotransferase
VPRGRTLSGAAQGVRSSVFARLQQKIAAHKGELFPLHIGDTHLLPPDPVQKEASATLQSEHDRYGPPAGLPELSAALVRKVRTRNGFSWASSEHIQISAGATHALFAGSRAVLDPGEEVLLPSPYWPLIAGIVQLCGAIAREVPFYQSLYQNPGAQ